MTRIEFYSNAESRLHTACKLVAKAFSEKTQVMIFAPDDAVARAVDRLLWTFQSISFIPHCLALDPLAPETPVLIARNVDDAPHDGLLVNLAMDCPPAFGRFGGLIEVVGRDEEDRVAARARWRYYKERGYEVNHIDLNKV